MVKPARNQRGCTAEFGNSLLSVRVVNMQLPSAIVAHSGRSTEFLSPVSYWLSHMTSSSTPISIRCASVKGETLMISAGAWHLLLGTEHQPTNIRMERSNHCFNIECRPCAAGTGHKSEITRQYFRGRTCSACWF